MKGKKPTVLGIEFGEKVLNRVKTGSKLEKINAVYQCGLAQELFYMPFRYALFLRYT